MLAIYVEAIIYLLHLIYMAVPLGGIVDMFIQLKIWTHSCTEFANHLFLFMQVHIVRFYQLLALIFKFLPSLIFINVMHI